MEPPTLSIPRALLIFALVGAVEAPSRAHAWSTAGHRLVCEQAWDELKPESATRVGKIIGLTSRAAFADRCRHADIVPADLMSLPADARDLNLDRDCPAADGCPVREIERALADLKSGQGDMADAVMRLAHFTGEVHQPLSVGYAADRNGIDIPAVFLGRTTTMHGIWNEELVSVPRPARAADTAFDLRAITNYLDRPRWTLSPPLAWATESYWIMRTPATGYVGNPGDLAFDEVFVAQNKLTAMEQIEKAGIRLAHLLNQAFGDPNGSSLPLSPPSN
jgi:hypothetical protein